MSGRRPNVMYHLATTLASVWRQYPHTVHVDAIVTFLLYKEPCLDAKERYLVRMIDIDIHDSSSVSRIYVGLLYIDIHIYECTLCLNV
jgi:hypothetical protein